MHPYERSTTLIFDEISFSCHTDCCTNEPFEFILIFGLITGYKFMKTNTNNHNDVYCMSLKLAFRYEQLTTLILHGAWLEFIESGCLSKLFEFIIISVHVTVHKSMKININTPHYVYCEVFQLIYRSEHS